MKIKRIIYDKYAKPILKYKLYLPYSIHDGIIYVVGRILFRYVFIGYEGSLTEYLLLIFLLLFKYG